MRIGMGAALVVAMWAGAMWTGAARAQSALCENPAGFCGKMLSGACLSRLGAGAAAAGTADTAALEDDCATQLQNYGECVAAAAGCGETPTAAASSCSDATALALWSSAERDNNCIGYQAFRDACPDSPQARFVASRLHTLGCEGGAAGVAPAAPAAATREPAPPEPNYRAAQTELRRLGLYTSSIDGDWGAGSQRAMQRFQQQADISPTDGSLTLAGLEALRKAPTPARDAPQVQAGYVGAYKGSWRNPQIGASGRSEFLALSYDPNSSALRGRMAIEYNGVVYQGIVVGTVSLADGGRLSGQIRAPDNSGWNTTLTLNPTSSFDVMTGSFYSVPLPGAFGFSSNGVFETRRVK